jgi:formyl-CoA transferase
MVNHYGTSDGRRFLLCLLDVSKDWTKLCTALGRPEWIADERYSTPAARREHSAEIVRMIDAITEEHPLEEWKRRFAEQDVLFGVVPEAKEHPDDQQMVAAGVFAEVVDGPTPMKTVTSPFHLAGVPESPARWAPEVGEHTVEVLREAGCDEREIRAMLESGAALQRSSGS